MSIEPTEQSHSPATLQMVVIASNGPIFGDEAPAIAGRAAIHCVVLTDPKPLPLVATTIATGVGPLLHGVVTQSDIDPQTLQLSPITARSRRFPAFWSELAGQGKRTLAIDWPATVADPDLEDAMTPPLVTQRVAQWPDLDRDTQQLLGLPSPASATSLALERHGKRLAAVYTAADEAAQSGRWTSLVLAMRWPPNVAVTAGLEQLNRQHVESLIARTPDTCWFVIVHRLRDHDALGRTRLNPDRLTLIGPQLNEGEPHPVSMPSIGGAIRILTGCELPTGIAIPHWRFVNWPELSADQLRLPLDAKPDDTDWSDIVNRVLSMPEEDLALREPVQTQLCLRFTHLAMDAMQQGRLDELETLGRHLIALRGELRDHWWLVYALHRGDRHEALPEAIDAMLQAYPNVQLSEVVKAMRLINHDAPAAARLLQDLDPERINIIESLGTLGRLCLRAGLEDQGVAALNRSIQLFVAAPVDRVALAHTLLERGDANAAVEALGPVGKHGGLRLWQLIRLRALVEADQKTPASNLANRLLHENPNDAEVLSLINRVNRVDRI